MNMNTGPGSAPTPNSKKAPLTAEEKAALQAEWDKKLEGEGLPPEPSQEQASTEASPEIEAAHKEALLYYLTTDRNDWGAHREKHKEIMQTNGVSEDDFPEDMMRAIEDEAAALVGEANKVSGELVQVRPALGGNFNALEKNISASLRKTHTALHTEIIRAAAAQAAGIAAR